MKQEQEHSPKYWVVHDKTSDDVFINTASKGMGQCEENFVEYHGVARYGCMLDRCDLWDKFMSDEDLEPILVEINIVKV